MLLGCSPYLNALPLTLGLNSQPEVELTLASPSRLADMLRAGKLDAALCSSSEYFSGDYRIIHGGALSSAHVDADAVLYAKVPYTHIRTVALSAASRSTNLMLKVLLHRLCPGAAVSYELRPDDVLRSLADFDAVLLIGDYAIAEHEAEYRYCLAEMWYQHNGLPMVFSLWLARPGADPHVAEVVQTAMRQGVAAREALAMLAAKERGLDHGAVRSYLLEALDYGWSGEHERSLTHFGEELQEIGLIPATRPLLYFGESGDQTAAPVESSQRT